MNGIEVRALLSRIAQYDNRDVTDILVASWADVLPEGLTYETATAAVREFFSDPDMAGEYLTTQRLIEYARKVYTSAKRDSDAIHRAALERARADAEAARRVADPQDYGPRLLRTLLGAALSAPRTCQGGPVRRGAGTAATAAALEEFRGMYGLSPTKETPRLNPCRNPLCVCTHEAPCSGGFIAVDEGDPTAQVVPCPTCKPRASAIATNAKGDRRALALMREVSKDSMSGGDDW